MSLQHSEPRTAARAGWFAIGALAASMGFVMLVVAGDYFQAIGKEANAEAGVPSLIIEAR